KRSLRSWCTTYTLAALVFLAGVLQTPLAAQTNTAVFARTVFDHAGLVLPNAKGEVKNQATGGKPDAVTRTHGRFFLGSVPTGPYTIAVSATGFNTTNKTEVEVALGKSDALSISLAVGTVSQSIEVRATASLAAHNAPSQGSLDAQSPVSLISPHYIQNFV